MGYKYNVPMKVTAECCQVVVIANSEGFFRMFCEFSKSVVVGSLARIAIEPGAHDLF